MTSGVTGEDIDRAAAALWPRGSLNFRRAKVILELHVVADVARAAFERTGDITYRDIEERSRVWRQRVAGVGLFDED